MTSRETVRRLPSRQERFARALAVLIMSVGILLIGIAFIFRSPSLPAPPPEASSDELLTTAPALPAVPSTEAEPATTTDAEPAESQQAEAPTETTPSAAVSVSTETDVKPEIATDATNTDMETVAAPVEVPEPTEQEKTADSTEQSTTPAANPTEKTIPEPQTLAQADMAEPAPPPETLPETESAREQVTIEPAPEKQPPAPDSDAAGWIYAGQFVDGQWLEQGLVIGSELPAGGQNYALNWGANIRATPPGKDTALSKTIGYLPKGKQVQIEEVKKSGNKGHIWLKIKH